METGRWKRLQNLFIAAREADDVARDGLLRDLAGTDPELAEQLRRLLHADAQPGIMDATAAGMPWLFSILDDVYHPLPDRIGAYRISRELGRGGMGVVYLATRADGEFDQRVAIKLIGTSDAADPLHRRFLAERQILAGLVHPNIARLLDGGITSDGRPYLVMEHVDGLPITTYCDTHRLDVPARVRLCAGVCAAVQHAHQNLVIHRDLKPSNILVSADGCPHLLDFGIAKLIDPAVAHDRDAATATRIEWRMMTPKYASPEQVRGGTITTASDIYSLGVLLYELLCGCSPYQLAGDSPVDLANAVCDQDPERPSARVRSQARVLAGDLDGIVLMALRKEPERRYASVDMLRQDLERYLARLPVLAHRGSRLYRLQKFVRRRRVETTAAALVLAALLTGLSVAVYHERRATRERDRAEQALAESIGVSRFLLDLFQSDDAGDAPPAQVSALDLLKRGARRVDDLSTQPIVQARLLDVIGQLSLNLGRLDDAQQRFEQAVSIRRATPGASPLDLAESLIHLAWVHRARNDYDRARVLVTEALDLRREALPLDHQDVAEALYELGWISFGPQQEQLYRDALAILASPAHAGNGSAAERRVTLLQGLSTNMRRQGRLTDALAVSREGVDVAGHTLGPDHHATGHAMIHLADHVSDIEQNIDTAERLYRRGLDIMTRRLGEDSVRLLHGLNSLAALLAGKGDNGAELLYRRALAISRTATGDEHPRVADQLHRLAGELARQQRLAEAEAIAREALDLSTRLLGPDHQTVASHRLPLLATVLDRQRRYDEADQIYRQAFDRVSSIGVIPGEMHRDYGLMLLRRRDHVRAEQELLHSLTLLDRAYRGAPHPNVQETKRGLMVLYAQWGRPDAIEQYRVPPGRFIPR